MARSTSSALSWVISVCVCVTPDVTSYGEKETLEDVIIIVNAIGSVWKRGHQQKLSRCPDPAPVFKAISMCISSSLCLPPGHVAKCSKLPQLPLSLSVFLLLLLLQRSTAVQVRSSVWLMPQNQTSGRGLLPSPTT